MCWRKQTIYKGCRHGRIEEIVCDDEKKRRRGHAYPTTSAMSSRRQSHPSPQQQQEQNHTSPWLALLCPCFFFPPAAPPREEEERCRPRPTLEPLNGKCPRCLEEEANAAVLFSGAGAVAEASRRHGFIGDKHLHAAGRPVSRDAYGATGPHRDRHRERPRPSRSRREDSDPAATGHVRPPLYTNVRYEEAVQRERLRREHQNVRSHEHYSRHTQRTPGYRSNQGASDSEAGFGGDGNADDQPFQPRASTAHLVPRPLQRSATKEERETALRARADGRSTARARKSPPLSVVLEDRDSWRVPQGDTAAGPGPHAVCPESTPGLPLDELMEEVEGLWRTAPNQRR